MKNVGEAGSANVAVVEVPGGAETPDAWETRLRDERSNAFDVIRLVLATMVVFAHSYFLVDGQIDREPLWVLSHGQLQSGQATVYLSLCISGFLVTRSFLTSRGLRSYLLKRVARIVPGFLAATFFSLVISRLSWQRARSRSSSPARIGRLSGSMLWRCGRRASLAFSIQIP